MFAQRSGGMFERRLVAVFGGHAAFLVKFAEIEQIVCIVADGVAAGSALVGRRQPQVGNAQFGQVRGALGGLLPQFAAVGVVPVEELQQGGFFVMSQRPG